jgi:hypothetical protein
MAYLSKNGKVKSTGYSLLGANGFYCLQKNNIGFINLPPIVSHKSACKGIWVHNFDIVFTI